jgi:hypothetical protein
VLRRHGFAALSTTLLVVAVLLLAINEERAAVFVTLGALVATLVGAAVTASHRA